MSMTDVKITAPPTTTTATLPATTTAVIVETTSTTISTSSQATKPPLAETDVKKDDIDPNVQKIYAYVQKKKEELKEEWIKRRQDFLTRLNTSTFHLHQLLFKENSDKIAVIKYYIKRQFADYDGWSKLYELHHSDEWDRLSQEVLKNIQTDIDQSNAAITAINHLLNTCDFTDEITPSQIIQSMKK